MLTLVIWHYFNVRLLDFGNLLPCLVVRSNLCVLTELNGKNMNCRVWKQNLKYTQTNICCVEGRRQPWPGGGVRAALFP